MAYRAGKREKLFVFFGADIDGQGREVLQSSYREGYTPLPLDAPALCSVISAQLPYTLINDFLDWPTICAGYEKSLAHERGWFRAASDAFTVDGICWPNFDRHAMHWFWLNVTLADAFARAFQANAGTHLKFFRHQAPRPGLYYNPSDVGAILWASLLGDTATVLLKSEKRRTLRNRLAPHKRFVLGKLSNLKPSGREGSSNFARADLAGKVVLAVNSGEIFRFSHIIAQLTARFPGRVAVALLSPDAAAAAKIAATWSIPVLCAPQPRDADPRLKGKFQQAFGEAIRANKPPLDEFLSVLKFHFDYYCDQRWPNLVEVFRFWSDLWHQAQPKAVLVSSLYDAESQLPAEAAKRFGIPTFSIPHGGVTIPDDRISSDHVLYGFPLHALALEQAGISKHRLTPCTGLVAENEYPVVKRQIKGESVKSWKVLVLTNPTGLPGNPSITFDMQLLGLEALKNPPEDIAAHLALTIKVNPYFDELALLSAVGGGLEKKALPPDTELGAVLETTDLVIGVNYLGSALLGVLRAGKPLVQFWVNECTFSANARNFLPAGVLVRNHDELWDSVRRFFTDHAFAEELQEKAATFYRDFLDNSDYPSIADVVERNLLKPVSEVT